MQGSFTTGPIKTRINFLIGRLAFVLLPKCYALKFGVNSKRWVSLLKPG
jgi:hypothetical protein